MTLPPKNQHEFEQWYKIQYGTQFGYFNDLPFTFQSGVYLQYFDSVGILISTRRTYNGSIWVYHAEIDWDTIEINTDRLYALKAAIISASQKREARL